MKVYKAPIVSAIQSYYGELLFPKSSDSIYIHLSKIADRMYQGLKQKEKCLYTQLNNYNPNYLGASASKLKNIEFDPIECQQTIANEYGFNSWEDVQKLEKTYYNIDFENSVNALIAGDINLLKRLIESSSILTQLHSQYGHAATLLHYTASNGVELWRQQVPQNLAEIIGYLIEKGADRDAKMCVYGSEFTAYELYQSSAHPQGAKLNPSTADLLNPHYSSGPRDER